MIKNVKFELVDYALIPKVYGTTTSAVDVPLSWSDVESILAYLNAGAETNQNLTWRVRDWEEC